MEPYRPLSKRGVHDVDLDSLHETVQPWMVTAITRWLDQFVWLQVTGTGSRVSNEAFLQEFEVAHRLREPLDRQRRFSAGNDFEHRVSGGGTFGFDAVNFALSWMGRNVRDVTITPRVVKLRDLLESAGAVWEPTNLGTPTKPAYTLTRRDLAAAKDAIAEVESVADRPGRFLMAAWGKVATRDPDPNGAYDNAIKAVEAAAHSVVSPSNTKATLGTMIRDLNAKPEKWAFALGDVQTVITMAEALWSNHFRHGTQQRDDHTLAEADAAVHLAIPLVRYFAGGLVTLK